MIYNIMGIFLKKRERERMFNKFAGEIINYKWFNLREGRKLKPNDITDSLIIYLTFILIVYLHRDCTRDPVVKITKIISVSI